MKKIKIFTAAVVRGALILAPGVIFFFWQWGKVSSLVNILAAVGLETLFLLVFSVVKVGIDVARKQSKSSPEQNSDDAETEVEAQDVKL